MGEDTTGLAKLQVMLDMFMKSQDISISEIKKSIELINSKLETHFVTKQELPSAIENVVKCRESERLSRTNKLLDMFNGIKDIIVTIGIIAIAYTQVVK